MFPISVADSISLPPFIFQIPISYLRTQESCMGMANLFLVLQLSVSPTHISHTTHHSFSLAPTHVHENTGIVSSPLCVAAVNLEELSDAPTTMPALVPRLTPTTLSRELPSLNTSLPPLVVSLPHLLPLPRRSLYFAQSKLVFNFRSIVLADTSRKAIILNALELVPRSTSLPCWSTQLLRFCSWLEMQQGITRRTG